MNILIGIFILLRGLVHMWYVTLVQGWVEFQANMGWTGKSWLLSNLLGSDVSRMVATIFYGLSTISFLVAGVGLLAEQDWFRTCMNDPILCDFNCHDFGFLGWKPSHAG